MRETDNTTELGSCEVSLCKIINPCHSKVLSNDQIAKKEKMIIKVYHKPDLKTEN